MRVAGIRASNIHRVKQLGTLGAQGIIGVKDGANSVVPANLLVRHCAKARETSREGTAVVVLSVIWMTSLVSVESTG